MGAGMSRSGLKHEGPTEQAWVDGKRAARMERVDGFDPETRALVHQYGLNVVTQFHNQNITSPSKIRHLVETVLDEFSPTRGTFSGQGRRVELIGGRS